MTRRYFGQVPVDVLRFDDALARIDALIASGRGGAVFTPNVDHVVVAQTHAEFRRAYQDADLSLADGQPLIWASRLSGVPLPEKLSGSDLFVPLMQRAAANRWRVFLLGGAPGVAESARTVLERDHGVNVVGTLAPTLPERPTHAACAELAERLRNSGAQLVAVALGAPKQELLIHALRQHVPPAVFIGVGAALDFVCGRQKRAPKWLSSAGLEWAFRLMQEPARLWRRYLVRDPAFALIVMRDLWAHRRRAALEAG